MPGLSASACCSAAARLACAVRHRATPEQAPKPAEAERGEIARAAGCGPACTSSPARACNVVVWSGSDGVGAGRQRHWQRKRTQLLETIARIAPGPACASSSTRTGHPDHTGGNEVAAPQGRDRDRPRSAARARMVAIPQMPARVRAEGCRPRRRRAAGRSRSTTTLALQPEWRPARRLLHVADAHTRRRPASCAGRRPNVVAPRRRLYCERPAIRSSTGQRRFAGGPGRGRRGGAVARRRAHGDRAGPRPVSNRAELAGLSRHAGRRRPQGARSWSSRAGSVDEILAAPSDRGVRRPLTRPRRRSMRRSDFVRMLYADLTAAADAQPDTSKLMPCASGRSAPQLTVQVCRRM